MVAWFQVWYNWKKSKFKYSSPKSSLQARLINHPESNEPPSPFPHFPNSPALLKSIIPNIPSFQSIAERSGVKF